MYEIIKNVKKESKNAEEERKTFSVLSLAWELGYLIAIPIVFFALIGRLLDKHLGTSPWMLLIGILISIFFSSYGIYLKTIKIFNNLNDKNKK